MTTEDLKLLIAQKREQAMLIEAQARRDGKAWDGKRWLVWNTTENRFEDPK